MYRTTEKNGGSEFSLLFMELYDILKDIIATGGHGSDGAVENLKYRIHRFLSKEYEDKDCRKYVKRLKRGDSLFTFIMHDVEYHNNVSERALRRLSVFRKILWEQVRCRCPADQDPHEHLRHVRAARRELLPVYQGLPGRKNDGDSGRPQGGPPLPQPPDSGTTR